MQRQLNRAVALERPQVAERVEKRPAKAAATAKTDNATLNLVTFSLLWLCRGNGTLSVGLG
jgi:hypothetical protein